MDASKAIRISSAKFLPPGELVGPMNEQELSRVNIEGQLFCLTHAAPKTYSEYFLLPRFNTSKEAE